MNITDYWPLAREYSIWNTTVTALQFWIAVLKAHVLSSTIEQVYNAFFYTTSMHLLCQQSEEVLFGHFMTTLNAVFESKLTLEDEGYESGSEISTYPLLSDVLPESTMFPVMTTSPFTPPLHAAQVQVHHVASVFDASYQSVLLTMKKAPQLTFHLPKAPHHHRTLWVLNSKHATSPSIPCVMT